MCEHRVQIQKPCPISFWKGFWLHLGSILEAMTLPKSSKVALRRFNDGRAGGRGGARLSNLLEDCCILQVLRTLSKHALHTLSGWRRIPVRYANTAGPRGFIESIATKERIERRGGRREERR